MVHEQSPRSDKPFVDINCAALPEALLESELFGYEKGAFTSAAGTKKGLFEIADGGTLFLDEIGEMKPELQAKLLTAIEQKNTTPRKYERRSMRRPHNHGFLTQHSNND